MLLYHIKAANPITIRKGIERMEDGRQMKKGQNTGTAPDKGNRFPGLYAPRFEHDNCGIGAVVNMKGQKTHKTVEQAIHIVENLEHRAGKDGEGKTGDGVGIMLQISHKFFKKVTKPLGIELGDEREYGVGMFFFPRIC